MKTKLKLLLFALLFGAAAFAQGVPPPTPVKISELPSAIGKGKGAIMPIVENNVTKKLPIDSLLKLATNYADSLKVLLNAGIAANTASILLKLNKSDTAAMLAAYRAAINTKISNITGLISQGANVTITGNGTSSSPYIINSVGGTGGVGNYDSAFVGFDVSPNTITFRTKSGLYYPAIFNIPPSMADVRRVPGSLQVQKLISGIWYDAYIDSIGGGSSGASGYFGDTLFTTTTDGNLNSKAIVQIGVGETVAIEVFYLGIKEANAGTTSGKVTITAWKDNSGALFFGSQKIPYEDQFGTAGGGANITGNGSGNVSINLIGQGGTSYFWKLYYTVKRNQL